MNSIDLNKVAGARKKTATTKKHKSWLAVAGEFMQKDFKFNISSGFDDKFKEDFYAELALLLSEGIDVKTAFTIILEETENEQVSIRLKAIQLSIVNGEKFADSIRNDKSFTTYEYYSIAIGEESGQLIEVLKEMSLYFQRKIKLKRQLTSALIYPSIVLMVAFGTIAFMLNFVVPMFSEVFKRFKDDLPYVTKLIISFSLAFKSYFWLLALFFFTLLVIYYTQRKKEWLRNYTSKIILRIPVLGELVRKIYLARFSQSLSLLLRSKVSIIKSLDMVKNMVNFYPIEITTDTIKEKILKGDSLHTSLASFPIYNRKMVNMIKVAEDVNKLDEMLGKISTQFSNETEHQIELFNKLLEPVLIIFLGLIVGFILIAMYLPLFQLGTQIGA